MERPRRASSQRMLAGGSREDRRTQTDRRFHSFWIRCTCPESVRREDLTGYRIASAVLGLVRRYDARLSARLHASTPWPRGIKPYTISPATLTANDREVRFRMTLLRGDLFAPIESALRQLGREFCVQGCAMPVVGLELHPASNRWVASEDIDAIIDAAPCGGSARVLFATPTTFHDTVTNEQVCAPDASLVVGSLLPRWAGYGSERISGATLERLRAGVRVGNVAVFPASAVVKGQRLDGFLGELELIAPDAASAMALHALLGLAFYSGIGMKTAVGMGQALRLERSEAAPWRPALEGVARVPQHDGRPRPTAHGHPAAPDRPGTAGGRANLLTGEQQIDENLHSVL